MLMTDFLTKIGIFTINDLLYLFDLALCDFDFFGKLHFSMKGKCYAGIQAIQKV